LRSLKSSYVEDEIASRSKIKPRVVWQSTTKEYIGALPVPGAGRLRLLIAQRLPEIIEKQGGLSAFPIDVKALLALLRLNDNMRTVFGEHSLSDYYEAAGNVFSKKNENQYTKYVELVERNWH
jgi:hypothetical protein